MPVIGFLDPRSLHYTLADQQRAFRQGLKDAGYVEGENVVIEYRWAEGQIYRLPALAAELVRRHFHPFDNSSVVAVGYGQIRQGLGTG
jgi:ABC-type uncharacterized transport system substrate-binding protein